MNSQTSALLVPINVEALCVNSRTQTSVFMPALTNFDELPYNNNPSRQKPFLSELVGAQPFASGSPLELGVHLHWAMPDGLMHGEQAGDAAPKAGVGEPASQAFRFPLLPDRWLVTRTELGSPGASVSWVVDSRFVAETVSGDLGNERSPSVPWDNPTDPAYKKPPFRYVGRKLRLENWAAPARQTLLPELTAASLGLLQAPAYYPGCRNVFGMHDPAPAKAAEYLYTVIGWHAEPGDDPLTGKDAATTAQALGRLRWNASEGATFARTLYVGSVHSVRWDAEREPKRRGPLTAVFGNTTSEASAALHEDNSGNASRTFRSEIQALVTGQLNLLTEPGGETRVTRQFHRSRFSPATFGSQWYVGLESDGSDVYTSLPAELKHDLADLNAKEQARVARRDEAAAKQWQLFADWYKYLKCKYAGQDENLPKADPVRRFIDSSSLPAARTAVTDCEAATGVATDAWDSLKGKLSPAQKLFARPLPSTWRPVDPILLLQGQDVKPALRFGGEGELACRAWSEGASSPVISAVTLRDGDVAGIGAATVDAVSDPPNLGAAADKLSLPVPLLRALALEGRMLWPGWAAARLAARARKPEASANVQQWLNGKVFDASPSPWSGKPPSRNSVTPWAENPWLPILMHWDISYQPLAIIQEDKPEEMFPPQLVMKRIENRLDEEEVDLLLLPQKSGVLGDTLPRHYNGLTFITPQAGRRVKQQLKVYGVDHPESRLAALEPDVKDIPLLSQSLSGFHDRLLLRRQTLQVDIRDPYSQGKVQQTFAENVRKTVMALNTRVTTTAPIVQDAFNPVRGGDFWLERLWLVDVFGQCRQFAFGKSSHLLRSGEDRVLVAPAMGRNVDGSLQPMFPPRLSQAARVDFRWVEADGDEDITGLDPEASPICGWVVPNFIERSLAIYDASGDSLGAVQIIADNVTWQPSPAHPEFFTLTPEQFFERLDRLKRLNRHLRDFTLALLGRLGTAKYLNAYLDTLHNTSMLTQPLESVQHANLPVLIGQPLALTRASLKLSLAGPPAVNQTWAAFRRDSGLLAAAGKKNQAAIVRTTNDHEKVEYPVVLGMANDPDDGLAGFYQGADTGQERFAEFFAVAPAHKDSQGIRPRAVHTLQLTAAQPRQVLTMLVDPRAQVVVTTGYTPAQVQTLPAEAVKRAFEKIAVTFLCAPILTREAPPSGPQQTVRLPLPLPGQQKGTWNWVRVALDDKGDPRAILARAEAAPTDQVFSENRLHLQEGWLSLGGLDPGK
jgi:hypothetical protein